MEKLRFIRDLIIQIRLIWRRRMTNEYYGIPFIDNVVIRNDDINDICNNYIEGLWNIKYT